MPATSPGAASALPEALPAVPAPTTLPTLPGLPPSEAPAAASDPLPNPDAPLPSTQAELCREMDGITEYVVASFPDEPDALEIKARYQKWLGNSTEAVRLWERCLALNPKYAYAYYGIGTVAASRGEHLKAAESFRKALASNPDWPRAEVELARALVNATQSDEAVAVLEKHLQRRMVLTEARVLLGQAHFQRKDFAKAKASYAQAIQSGAATADAFYGLALACARLGEKDEAKQHMDKFQALRAEEMKIRKRDKVQYNDLEAMKGDTAGICTSAARLFLARANPAQAEKLCRRAAAFDPSHIECRQALAWLCRRSGRIAEAIGFLRQVAELDPNDVTCLIEVGRLEVELKQFDAAEATLRTVCQRDPKGGAGPAALAQLCLAAGRRLTEARKWAEKAVELEPAGPNYVVLAAVCEKQNDLPAALAAMKRATELDRDNPGYRKAYQWLQTQQPAK
jgi:tetratricopeptide (TPR) repeat protein